MPKPDLLLITSKQDFTNRENSVNVKESGFAPTSHKYVTERCKDDDFPYSSECSQKAG